MFSLLFQTRHFKSSPEQSSKVEKLRSGAEEFLDKTLGTDATLIFSPSQVCNTGPGCADPGVVSSIPAQSHTLVEIDYEIISTVILPLPLNHSRRIVVSYKRKYVQEVLFNCLFKLAQEKSVVR